MSHHCCFFAVALVAAVALGSVGEVKATMDLDSLLLALLPSGSSSSSTNSSKEVEKRLFQLASAQNVEDPLEFIQREQENNRRLNVPPLAFVTTTTNATTTSTSGQQITEQVQNFTTTRPSSTTTSTRNLNTTQQPSAPSATNASLPLTNSTEYTTDTTSPETTTNTETTPTTVTTNATATTNTTASATKTTRTPHRNVTTFDYSKCAVFPACSVHRDETGQSALGVIVTCHRPAVIVILVVVIVLAVIIVISNIVIITVISCSPTLRKPHGYFKLSLAVADILNGIIVLPVLAYNVANEIAYDDYGDRMLLRQYVVDHSASAIFFCIVGILSSIATLYSLLLLSVDRYLSVRWPMKYRVGELMTTKRSLVALALVWCLAVVVAALPAMATQYFEFGKSLITLYFMPRTKSNSADTSSFVPYMRLLVYAVLIWGVPFVATWALTILSSIQSRKMLMQMKDSRRQSTRSDGGITKLDRDLRRTVAVVLVLFTLTVLPIFALLIEQSVNPGVGCTESGIGNAILPCFLILVSGSFLNVLVYNTCNKEFRESTRKLAGFIATNLCRGKRHAAKAAEVKRSLAYWQSPAGRSLWNAKYGNRNAVPSSKSMRTLSGETVSTGLSNSRTKSTSSADSDTMHHAHRMASNSSSVGNEPKSPAGIV